MNEEPKPCAACGEMMTIRYKESRKRFAARVACSRKCQGIYLRRYSDKPCEECGEMFRPDMRRTRFCSRECWRAFTTGPESDTAYVIGEVEFLAGTDEPWSLARRLGYASEESLVRTLERHGRLDLAAHFRSTQSDNRELAGSTTWSSQRWKAAAA